MLMWRHGLGSTSSKTLSRATYRSFSHHSATTRKKLWNTPEPIQASVTATITVLLLMASSMGMLSEIRLSAHPRRSATPARSDLDTHPADHLSQTEHAVRVILQARPDMTASEARAAKNLMRRE